MKKFISMLFTFILILLVLLTTILLISKSTILNESYILKQIEEEAYYDKVAENLRESFKSNILQSGLEEEFVEELIDEEKIRNDINGLVNSIYNNTDYNIETESIVEKLDGEIERVLDSRGSVLTDDAQESIDRFIKAMSNVYVNEIVLIEGSQDVLKNIVSVISEYINIVIIILIVAIVVFAVLLVLVNRNIKFLGKVLFANAFIIFFGYIFINWNINVNNILMFTESFSTMLSNIISKYMNVYLYVAILYFVIGIVVSILSGILGERKSSKH